MGAHYLAIDSTAKLIGSQPTLTEHLAHNRIVKPLHRDALALYNVWSEPYSIVPIAMVQLVHLS